MTQSRSGYTPCFETCHSFMMSLSVSQVSQPAGVDPLRLRPHHRLGRGHLAAELQENAPPPPGELRPHHQPQPGGRGGSRRRSGAGEGGLLPEHHSGGAAGCQGGEARRPADGREERRHDPWQQAPGEGAAEEGATEGPAVLLREEPQPLSDGLQRENSSVTKLKDLIVWCFYHEVFYSFDIFFMKHTKCWTWIIFTKTF